MLKVAEPASPLPVTLEEVTSKALAVASDAGIRPGRPHDVLPYGAVAFAGLGMSNADALRTVTENPAAACGLSERKGRLAKGYDADLVAFDGHPLFDITALLRPVEVIRAGEPVLRRQARQ